MQQGTQEWLERRRQSIGSSDTPVILGLSPYSHPTIAELIKEKRGEAQPRKNEWVLQKGHEIEAKVRAKFELTSDGEFPPAFMENGIYHASLDGFNSKIGMPIEIKYVGAKNVNNIPAHHYAQLMHLMYVSKTDKILFIRSNDGINTFETFVEFNPWFWKKAMPELERFWKRVKTIPRTSNKKYHFRAG